MNTKNTVIPIMPDGIKCYIHFFGEVLSDTKPPLFIMPVADEVPDLIEGQHMRLDHVIMSGEVPPHILVTFEIQNWNDDLSPWKAPPIGRSQSDFGGYAHKTLTWITDRLIPAVEQQLPFICGSQIGLLGYSMAGLFAVWAIYQTDKFAVFGSCSGSLWYEGFTEYLSKHEPAAPCSVYLSLGDREEFTRNPMFAKVGDATRQTEVILKASPMIRDITLTWNPGKHTGAVGERLAAAQLWMKKQLQELKNVGATR